MVGQIGKRFYFEFRDEEQLLYALDAFITRRGYTAAVISKSETTQPVAIINNGEYIKYPTNIQEETEYFIYIYGADAKDKEILESELVEKHPFIYKLCRVPVEFD